MTVAAIVCMSENRVIGKGNKMPWHLSEDLKRVKRLTTGHMILMGRKTFESLGKALPNRRNIIMTRQQKHDFPVECEVVHSVQQALDLQNEEEDLFIFGGSHIYEQFMPYVQTLYMTVIKEQMQGDAFFPTIDETEWVLTEQEQGLRNEKNPYDYEFLTYVRK